MTSELRLIDRVAAMHPDSGGGGQKGRAMDICVSARALASMVGYAQGCSQAGARHGRALSPMERSYLRDVGRIQGF